MIVFIKPGMHVLWQCPSGGDIRCVVEELFPDTDKTKDAVLVLTEMGSYWFALLTELKPCLLYSPGDLVPAQTRRLIESSDGPFTWAIGMPDR